MRKISTIMAGCFFSRKPIKLSNSEVVNKIDGTTELYLFNNKIASMAPNGSLFFSCCGWLTNTTLDRLRALGLPLSQKRGILYFRNTVISSYTTYNYVELCKETI